MAPKPCPICAHYHTRSDLSALIGIGLDSILTGGSTLRKLPDTIIAETWRLIDLGGIEAAEALRRAQGLAPEPQIMPTPQTPQAPSPQTPQAPQSGSLDEMIRAIIRRTMEQYPPSSGVDPAQLAEALRPLHEKIEAMTRPNVIEIRIPEQGPITLRGAHPVVPELVALAAAGERRMALAGPAGTGKSTAGIALAGALAFLGIAPDAVTLIPLSGGIMEHHIWGRVREGGSYTDTPFVAALRRPGVVVLDEMDAADPNVLLSLNAITSVGVTTLPSGEVLTIHADCVIVATMNTFGTGASRTYCGRNQLDSTSMDRYGGGSTVLEVDYAPSIEDGIGVDPAVLSWVRDARKRMAHHGTRRVLSTRLLVSARRQMAAGIPWATIKGRVLAPWSSQERAQIGEGN